MITDYDAEMIEKAGIKSKNQVCSYLSPEFGVCSKCYGANLATGGSKCG